MSVRSAERRLRAGWLTMITRAGKFVRFCVTAAIRASASCATILISVRRRLGTFARIAIEREGHKTVFELGAAFSVLYGISYWSVPAALITGGVAAIAIVEFRKVAK